MTSARLILPALLFVPLSLVVLPAQAQQKPKELLWTHAFDLSCRKKGEVEFTKETQKFGIEVFKDTNVPNLGVYISEKGSLAAVGTGFRDINKAIAGSKRPEWVTGLDLPARKAGEKEFSSTTTVYSMEAFVDPNTDNNWLFITASGQIAATGKGPKGAGNKAPKLSHSVDLNVRRGGEKDWKDAKKYGVECWFDPNTSNLIYICETGAIAVVPGEVATKAEGKAPEWLHGLDLACRKHNEYSFSKDTRRFGVEVFRDVNNGNLIFITETGNLAVTPGAKNLVAPTPKVTAPKWTHGLNMRCRKTDEKEFSDTTQAFGVEVFTDETLGVILYIAETGSLSAVKQQ
jgi:hypothetical protein